MLLQNDPFLGSLLGRIYDSTVGSSVPMDAYRRDNDVWVHMDLPGVAADGIEVSVERNVLTVTAERNFNRSDQDRIYISDRTHGTLKRQVHLGESLDSENIDADYTDGVLTLRVPISEKAKPRKIEVNVSSPTIETSAV